MISIEKAVHARLVREGLERARSSPDSEASEHDPVMEGRLTRAGRCACILCFHPRCCPTLGMFLAHAAKNKSIVTFLMYNTQ